MSRAAGNSSYYTLGLLRDGEPDGFQVPVPSVTSILDVLSKPALVQWGYKVGLEAASIMAQDTVPVERLTVDQMKVTALEYGLSPSQVRDRAGDRGTDAHNYLEQLAKGADVGPSGGYQAAVWKWWVVTKPHPIDCEMFLFSRKHWYAGTCDLIWEYEPGILNPEGYGPDARLLSRQMRTLTDLKTSKAVYPEHALQVAAYKVAWEEMTGETIDRTTILLAKEDGTYEETEVRGDFEMFLRARDLFNWRERQ